jgi:hypothetical protein
MAEWRDEVGRHGALADELRLPVFQWYTPLWHAVEAQLAGRFEEAERLGEEAAEGGRRAGDPNGELFALMVGFVTHLIRREFLESDLEFALDKVANSAAGPAYRCSVAWLLAELGRPDEAREHLAVAMAPGGLPFDANWMSGIGECAEACLVLGEQEHAAHVYDLLAPYAGRPITAGRAVTSYGSADRLLGELAALLGREADAERHLLTAVELDDAMGAVWAERGRAALARLAVGPAA